MCLFSTLLFAMVAGFYWRSQPVGTPIDVMAYVDLFLFFFFYGVLQWLFQKNTLSKLVSRHGTSTSERRKPAAAPRDTEADREIRKNREKRLFVHLFGMLQRQGRLMDFLQENLSRYEDAQIGAAVRSIHDNCRKTVMRYLSPEPVIDQTEGESVTIETGFDRQAVKLVGNVVGEPPFTGILRHRGWRLGSVRLPKLAETENPDIIAPAEVEIQ
ncbi:MAG: DUF2760 domain-containing protein [Desulfosarcina sp.]